jgi:predicted secreted protein
MNRVDTDIIDEDDNYDADVDEVDTNWSNAVSPQPIRQNAKGYTDEESVIDDEVDTISQNSVNMKKQPIKKPTDKYKRYRQRQKEKIQNLIDNPVIKVKINEQMEISLEKKKIVELVQDIFTVYNTLWKMHRIYKFEDEDDEKNILKIFRAIKNYIAYSSSNRAAGNRVVIPTTRPQMRQQISPQSTGYKNEEEDIKLLRKFGINTD